MNKDNDEAKILKLKEFILDTEGKALKELNASRGFTATQARGRIDSSTVNAILSAVNSLCEENSK